MILRLIFGPLGIVLGFLIVSKSEWLLENFGRVDFAEKYLGLQGGTRLFYKLLGILIMVIAFLYLTGFLGEIVLSIIKPLFGGIL